MCSIKAVTFSSLTRCKLSHDALELLHPAVKLRLGQRIKVCDNIM